LQNIYVHNVSISITGSLFIDFKGEYFNARQFGSKPSFASLQNKFFAVTDPFEENSQYNLTVEIGNGAFGQCFLAVEIPADDMVKGRLFCVKKVRLNCYYVQFSIKFGRYVTQEEKPNVNGRMWIE